MKFDTRCIPEPELEFGNGGLFIDPRIGLMRHGPLQDHTSQVVRVGVIGTSETVDGLAGYLERAMVGIDGAEDRLGNLAPRLSRAG